MYIEAIFHFRMNQLIGKLFQNLAIIHHYYSLGFKKLLFKDQYFNDRQFEQLSVEARAKLNKSVNNSY